MSGRLRVLVVDDEPPARDRLVAVLGDVGGCELLPPCAEGAAAVQAIQAGAPDLVFLDVQMPGLDGFGVIAEVGPERMPPVVFVTAYDEHAVRAFEVNAIDYVLKPYDRPRIRAALERARARGEEAHGALEARLRALLTLGAPDERVSLKSGGRTVLLAPREIGWLEAAGNYVRVHAGSETLLVRETLTALLARLPAGRFVRIHRSLVVRTDAVRELAPVGDGEYRVLLAGGKLLASGRTYRAAVEALRGSSR